MDTPVGPFVRRPGSDVWQGEATDAAGQPLPVFADDVDGAPDPDLLRVLPALLESLRDLEREARETVPDITDAHGLYSIGSGIDGSDATLDFGYRELDSDEIIVLHVTDGAVEGWGVMD